ncbi:MAG: MFS transporter, partial [Pseudomonadota bacterium]
MTAALERNIPLYRWSRFLRSLLFWQAVWFLYFQNILSAAEAILLYAVFDVAVTLLEVPSGYMSDRIGRRKTLLLSAVAAFLGALLLGVGDSFATFAAAQICLGVGGALASGTDEAILYESLEATNRAEEIEQQEVVAWRYSFSALALSAVTGGAMAYIDPHLPFYAGAVAMLGLLWVTWLMVEPPRNSDLPEGSELLRLRHLGDSFRIP